MASESVAARLDSINGSDYIEDSERFRIDAKKFLNELNDCLYMFSKIDTSFFKEHSKEIYEVYDLLRYEVLSDKEIDSLIKSHNYSSIARNINIYMSLVEELKVELESYEDQISSIKKDGDSLDKSIRDTNLAYNIARLSLPNMREAIAAIIATSTILAPHALLGHFIVKPIIHGATHPYSEVTKKILIDSEGRNSVTNSKIVGYDPSNNEVIINYSEPDENGIRVRKVYPYSDKKITNSEDLKDVDLSSIEPLSVEEVSEDEVRGITDKEYRLYVKKELIYKYYFEKKEIIGFMILSTLISLIVDLVVLGGLDVLDMFDPSINAYLELYDWAKYKKELKSLLKKLDKNDKKYKKLEKAVNTVCNRMDSLLKDVTRKIAEKEHKEIYIEYSRSSIDKKFKQIERETKAKEEELERKLYAHVEEYIEIYKDLYKLNPQAAKKYLHKFFVTEDELFEECDDHKVVKEWFRDKLKFFNLKTICWDNVDITGLDFRDTNADIDIKKTYGSKAENVLFDDRNISSFYDYEGTSFIHSSVEEKDSVFTNIDKANIDDDSLLNGKPFKKQISSGNN